MKRPLVFAVLAAVMAVAVYLLVIRDRDRDRDAAASDDRMVPAAGDDRSTPDRQRPPRTGTARAPSLGADAPDRVDRAGAEPPMYYEREDGTVVRDHRGAGAGEWVRPALPHRAMSPVDGKVTSAVMRQVRPVVLECMGKVPDSAFGASPVVMTRAQISIDAQGQLSVVELGPAVTDIDDAAVAGALACIRAAAPGLSAQVDHAAVDSATLALTIRPLDYRR